MDRVYHKKDITYNTDNLGAKRRLDIFIERINKKEGFAIVTYPAFENDKLVEKQYMPYVEHMGDIEDYLNNGIISDKKVHYIDFSHVCFRFSNDKEEKNYVNVLYVEYNDRKPKMGNIRIPKEYYEKLKNMIEKYRGTDPRLVVPFDGYSRDPIPKSNWISRMHRRKYGFPKQQESISSLVLKDIKAIIYSLRDYVLDRVGLSPINGELVTEEEKISRRAR